MASVLHGPISCQCIYKLQEGFLEIVLTTWQVIKHAPVVLRSIQCSWSMVNVRGHRVGFDVVSLVRYLGWYAKCFGAIVLDADMHNSTILHHTSRQEFVQCGALHAPQSIHIAIFVSVLYHTQLQRCFLLLKKERMTGGTIHSILYIFFSLLDGRNKWHTLRRSTFHICVAGFRPSYPTYPCLWYALTTQPPSPRNSVILFIAGLGSHLYQPVITK